MKKLLAFVAPGGPLGLWPVVAAMLAVLGAFAWHGHAAHKAVAAAEKRGEDRAYADVAERAREIEAKANALSARVAQVLRSKNDEEARRIGADADDLRVRGPGKAVCPGSAFAPPAASGHGAPGRPADAAVDPLPDPERPPLIALPFADAIGFAERCDLNRSEALTWREADERQRAAWPAPSKPQE